jgi:lysophospholipase L1-like esterase
MIRRLLCILGGLVLATSIAVVAASGPASAASCSPWPACFGTGYQVTGTPDNSLAEWTNSPALGGSAIRSVSNGYTLFVGCQANNGPQEDSKYNVYSTVPSTTWDFAWDGGLGRFVWVYDWWMNTPPQQSADGWYSWPDAAHHCNFGGSPPSSGGPGPYQVVGTDSQGLAIQSKPHANHVLRFVPNGTALNVQCQVNNGDQVDGRTQYGHPFTTWDRLSDGTWVYDWYLDTPVVATNGYSPGMPHCDDGSSPFIALGDSYSAGLGTYSYRSGDENPACHRSDKTYSVVYASTHTLPSWLGRVQPVLLACSGATTSALTGSFTTGNGVAEPAQLYTGALGQNTKLVTISIGGNDVGFATILSKCLDPRTQPGGDDCWLPALNDPGTTGYSSTVTGAYQQATRLQSTMALDYGLIRELAPNARVVVVAYPQIFPAQLEKCAQSLGIIGQMSSNSLHAIRDTWVHLNDVIKAAAANAGVSVMDDSAQWAGHDFCAGAQSPPQTAYANGLRGTWSIIPPSFTPDVESYHPTVDGYQQLASDLNNFINSNFP